MNSSTADTDQLIERVSAGDVAARGKLLVRHRDRLKRMVSAYLDRRLRARIDPSDVVQESLADADGQLDAFIDKRPVPFYVWLRQITWQRLIDLREHHLGRQKRSVKREHLWDWELAEDSTAQLAERLAASGTEPGERMAHRETLEKLHEALAALPVADRQILVMRYLEAMDFREIAAALEVTDAAVRSRHRRALARLAHILGAAQR